MKTANKKIILLVPVLLLLLSATTETRNPFPAIERYKLKNGLEVIFADYGDLPVTSLSLYVNVGKKSETPGQQGLAELTANALTLGSEKYSRVELDRRLYRMNGSIDAQANKNFTTVSAEFLNKDIDDGIEMLASVFLHPSFPQQDIEEIRGFTLSSNKPAKMDIGDLAQVYGDYFAYGIEHPLGRHFYEAQYRKLAVAQIREFYSFNYTPGNTKLVITGKPDHIKVKALIEQYFGAWTAAYGEMNGSSYDIPAIKGKSYAFVQKDGATQACLLWMKRAPEAGSKEMTAFILANLIFSDHLGKEIREKRGYTYGIYSTYSQSENDGIFRARTQVRNDVMYSTIEAFDLVLNDFNAKGCTDAELKKFKTMIRADLLSIEEPASVAGLINPWVYKDYDKRRKLFEELDAIDMAALNKTIKKYFTPDSYKLMIAGDEKALDNQLGKISGLQKLPLNVIEKDQ